MGKTALCSAAYKRPSEAFKLKLSEGALYVAESDRVPARLDQINRLDWNFIIVLLIDILLSQLLASKNVSCETFS